MHHVKTIISTCLFLLPVFAATQIVNIEDKRFRLKDSTDFEGTFTAGWNLNKNTNTIWSGNGALLLEKNQKRHFFIGYGFINLLRTGDKNLLNDRMAHLRHNYDMNGWLVWENFTQAQYSQQLRIRHRYLVGSGLRFKLHKIIGKRIYIGTAGMYEQMAFQQDHSFDNRYRISSYLSFQIPLYEDSKVLSTSYYQPIIGDWTTRRLTSQTSVVFPVGKHFSFKTSFTLLSDNDYRIEETVPNLTYQWANSLVWKISG